MNRRVVCAAIPMLLAWCASAVELGSIRLAIVDKQGQPVPGASVIAINWDNEIVRTDELRDNEKGTTDEKGQVTFKEKTIGQVFVRVQAGDQGGWFRVQDREKAGPVTLTLDTGQTVTGTLRDTAGAPIAGALILADSCLPIGETDAAGRFSVTNYGVGYSPQLIFAKEGFVPDGTHVHFEAAEVSFTLKRAVAIQGRVLMPDGTPVKDASVGGERRSSRPLRSGANGEFTISKAPVGEEITISASVRVKDVLYQARQRLTVTDPPPGPVTLQLEEVKFGSVRGRMIHMSTGEPVTGRVLLDTSNEFYNPQEEVNTDEEGRFVIESLYPGPYWLFAAPVTKTLYMVGGPKQVSITEETLSPEVELSVDDGCALRGSVLAADGTPVAGRQVMWQPMTHYRAIWTDEAGKFIIPYLDGAGITYTIEVSDDLQRVVSKTVGPLEKGQTVSDIELRMPPPMVPAPLRGNVRDEAGTPLPNVRLRFRYTESGSPWGVEATTDAKGEYSAQIVRSGPVEVAASIGVQIERDGSSDNLSRECEVLSTKTLTLEEGKDASLDLTVRTVPMGILAGTVTGPDGKPVHARLRLVYDGKERESSSAYREGEFMFRKLPAQPYLLEVTALGYKARVLRSGLDFVQGDVPVVIVLQPGPFAYDESVWETVTGTPATQESVDAYPEAKYVREREWSYHEEAKRPKRDETQRAQYQYKKPLRILDENGEPLKRVVIEGLSSLPDYEVLLYKEAGRQVQTQSSESGVYSLDPANSYGAIVSAPGLSRVYVRPEWTDKPDMIQDVVLRRPAALELVVRGQNGKALPNTPVYTGRFAWDNQANAQVYQIGATGAEGTLRFDALAPGFHGFAVGELGSTMRLVLVNVEPGETRKEAVELAANRTPDDAQSLLQQWRESKAS
ncbi:MAG: carboxypeptidase regulatory-like domain-containing protein, partial [Candidatus Hydrogenedentes bacterium]|nr:carboxypeptidase regulatory-like domain-containing protein [Candidatus Hydrogenedentota bacterium]